MCINRPSLPLFTVIHCVLIDLPMMQLQVDAYKKCLSTIGEEVRLLAQKAKDNSLKPEDYEGGTSTVSNLGGPFGVKQFCAVVNPPQAAILAVGSDEKRVVHGNGPKQFIYASYIPVTLSFKTRTEILVYRRRNLFLNVK